MSFRGPNATMRLDVQRTEAREVEVFPGHFVSCHLYGPGVFALEATDIPTPEPNNPS